MKSLTAALVLILTVAFVPARGNAQDWEVVRVAIGGTISALPAIVAQERGFFVQERVVASVWHMVSDEAVALSLAAGTTDFAIAPQRTLLLMAAARLPVTVVASSNWDTRLELVVPAGTTGIDGAGDLRGQRIAVDDGSDTFATLVRLLNHAEVALSEVEVHGVPPMGITEVFSGGLADAMLAPRYLTRPLIEAEEAVGVLDHEALVDQLGIIGAQPVIVRDELLDEDPEVVQRVVNALVKALVYINQDPEDAAYLLQVFLHRQGIRITAEDAQDWLAATRFDRYDWSARDAVEAEYAGWALHAARMFDVEPSLEGYTDTRFAERAWRILRGEEEPDDAEPADEPAAAEAGPAGDGQEDTDAPDG